MINTTSYTTEWLNSHREDKALKRINPMLREKMTYALSLVEQLAINKLQFVFKGGTSLILLLQDAGRFSIDIDIITKASRNEIELLLKHICSGTIFFRFELSEHRSYKEGIPKAHYSLFYNSALTAKEDHILLDILYDEHSYPELQQHPVQTAWLLTDEPYTYVYTASADSIAGDKLTAFAPTTTGILFGKGKEVEIIKQLHDMDKLYHAITDVETVSSSFNQIVEKEIVYRGKTCSRDDVFNDIIQTGVMIALREKNPKEKIDHFKEIQRGLLQFKSYQTSSLFRIDEAITASAKTALLATKIKLANTDPLPRFDSATMKKQDYLITHTDYNHLNKLAAEALFYWYHTVHLLH